ncbi:MAG: tRNA threonylcarbamoyladenosine biosynthesis protein TsaE [Parcubacteria group bacterium ADurb.Bin159]|nr:MAG: tRNA threonylcarbamoyladenosine biosynthesis protein TsaE [Parcubacteria group bacterium ADurb.Bin159]
MVITNSSQQTKKLGAQFAKNLKGGEIIGLIGTLGSGKTTFTQGMALGLNIKEKITSPSFILMQIYSIKKNKKIKYFVHIDGWRLKSAKELKMIGIDDYLRKKDAIIIIEWADKVKKILPKNSIIVRFKLGRKENQRIINFNLHPFLKSKLQ